MLRHVGELRRLWRGRKGVGEGGREGGIDSQRENVLGEEKERERMCWRKKRRNRERGEGGGRRKGGRDKWREEA